MLLQSLERCQLKEVVAAKPEKLEALGDHIHSFLNRLMECDKKT